MAAPLPNSIIVSWNRYTFTDSGVFQGLPDVLIFVIASGMPIF
jgi:hypothetical protein